MRIILAILLFAFASVSFGMMLDADGKPRIEPGSVNEVTRHCEMQGWFVVNSTVYMCTKIRENIDKKELRAYLEVDGKIQAKKREARDKWYNKWIKTEEGKAWQKEYDLKLKLERKLKLK